MTTLEQLGSFSPTDLGHAAALCCAATWAFATVVFGKIAQTVDPRALNFVKSALSAVLLVGTSVALGDIPAVSAHDLTALAVSAFFGLMVADTAYFVALRELGPARGVVFVSLIPVCTALLAMPVLHEPFTLRMAVGMVLTLGGVTLVVRRPTTADVDTPAMPASASPAPRHARRGVIAGVAYCAAQAAANVLTKATDVCLSPLALSSLRMSMGALLLGLWILMLPGARARFAGVRASGRGLASGAFIGTYVGVLLGTFALRTVSAGVATTLVATTPLFALLFAWIAGEMPRMRAVVGSVVACAGVAVLVL